MDRLLRYYAALRNMLVMGLLVSVLGSCIGLGSDITIRRDGSGIINLEYRLSRDLESLGKLEGNERWPTVPVGRADFERTAARIPGIKMTSFSAKTIGQDNVSRVTLEFSQSDALLRFLDATGQGASLSAENGKRRLSLTLSEGKALSPDLAALVVQSMEGYSVTLRFSLPNEAELFFSGAEGRRLAVPPVGEASVKGNRVEFAAPLGPLVTAGEPVFMEILW